MFFVFIESRINDDNKMKIIRLISITSLTSVVSSNWLLIVEVMQWNNLKMIRERLQGPASQEYGLLLTILKAYVEITFI